MSRLYHIHLKGAKIAYCVVATHFIIKDSYGDSNYYLMKFYLDDHCISMVDVCEVEYVSYFTDISCNEIKVYEDVPFPEVGKYDC